MLIRCPGPLSSPGCGEESPTQSGYLDMKIDIWSDIVCPWCYIGKRRFEAALALFAHRDEVAVRWHSFQLDPTTPTHPIGGYAERLAVKYGRTVPQAQQSLDDMTAAAAGEGLDFRFDLAAAGNTLDAHRLLHLAAERGVQDALKERLLLAVFTEGAATSEHEVLVELAVEVGLDAAEVRAVLGSDLYATEVAADQEQAQRFGISGVPFFVIDNAYGVSGAQPAEALLEVLDKAWADAHPLTMVTSSGASVSCEGDTCAV